jgi:adhesin/invasin
MFASLARISRRLIFLLTFLVSSVATAQTQGTVTVGGASAPAGGVALIPLSVGMNSGVSIDTLAIGIRVVPNGSAPSLSQGLTFVTDWSMPAPLVASPGPANEISVTWSNMVASLSGALTLGTIRVPVPAGAQTSDSYSVEISSQSASLAGTSVSLGASSAASVSVTPPAYLVGDVAPVPSAAGDLNGDGTYDDVGEFGNWLLTNLDLVSTLRAVTGVVRVPACSDRFDAMDSYPVDTPTTRGGDGRLTILDLIITLRRVVNLDSTRPQRANRGLVCPSMNPPEPAGTRLMRPALNNPRRLQSSGGAQETAANGTLMVGGAVSAQGASFSIPVTLNLNPGVNIDSLSIGIRIDPVGSAPLLTTQLSFTASSGQPGSPWVKYGTTSDIAVYWYSISPALSGNNLVVGTVDGTVPANASFGQAYTVAITGVIGSINNDTDVFLAAGPVSVISLPPPAGSISTVSGDNQTGVVGNPLAQPFVVLVRDTLEQPYLNGLVTFAVTAGGGSLSATSVTTDASGRASAVLTLGPTAGSANNVVTATIGELPAVTFAASAIAGPPAILKKVSGDGQAAFVGAQVANPIVVKVTDAYSNPVQGVVVSFTAAGGGNVNPASTTTGANGEAQAAWTLGPTVNGNTVTAAAGSLTAVTFNALAAPPPDAKVLAVSGTPQSGTVATALGLPLLVQVSTATNVPIQGVTVDFEVTPSGAATLSPPQGTTGSNGQAQVSVTLGQTAQDFTITASVAGVAQTASFSATANPDIPARLVIVSGNGQSAPAGTALDKPLVVKVTDQYSNPLSGVAVSFAVGSGGGSLSGVSPATGANGQAQASLTVGTVAGTDNNTVTVTSAGLQGVSFTASVTAGAPASIAAVSGDGQSGVVASILSAPLVVKVTDQYSNPVPNATVSFAVSPGGATVNPSSAKTDTQGRAQATLTLGTAAGSVSVSASVVGAAVPAVFSATATPGSPASLASVSGNNQVGAAGVPLPNPLVVKVADQYGNPVPGTLVYFAVISGGGSLSAGSVPTDNDGRAQVVWTLGSDVGSNNIVDASVGILPIVAFTATASVGAPALLAALSGDNQTAMAGNTLPKPLVVRLTDQGGRPVPGITVSFAVTAGGGSLSTASAVTNTNGQAQVFWTLGSVEGNNAAQASSGSLTPVTFLAVGLPPAAAQGTVTIAGTQGAPGGTAHIPVTLTLNSGLTANSVAFGIRVSPNGTALAVTGALGFIKDPGMAEPTLADTGGGDGVISVAWIGLPANLSGVVRLGEVVVPIPALAAEGNTYTVKVTAAYGASGDTDITLAAGPDAILSITEQSYLVGDVSPLGTDKNGDGDTDDAGEFGDQKLTLVDLIMALRAVTGVGGARPPACSDRFDATDAYPADTASLRGGDGSLGITDLIMTLRRVTGVDTTRWRRSTRGLACPASASPQPAVGTYVPARVGDPEEDSTRPGEAKRRAAVARLELGEVESVADGAARVPLYLSAPQELLLLGLTVAVGLDGAEGKPPLRYVPGPEQPPTIVDSELPGVAALAWLDGLWVKAGQRLLLGYIVTDRDQLSSLAILSASANSRADRSEVRIEFASRPPARRSRIE